MSFEQASIERVVYLAPRSGCRASARIRGQAVKSLVHAIAATFSEDRARAIFDRTRGELRARIDAGDFASSDWYPVAWVSALHEAARDEVGPGRPNLTRELRRTAMSLDARGIFRFVLRFASPSTLARHADRVWGLYLDGPAFSGWPTGPTSARFRYEHAPGYDNFLWEDHLGGLEAALALAGAVEPNARILEVSSAGDAVSGEVLWR